MSHSSRTNTTTENSPDNSFTDTNGNTITTRHVEQSIPYEWIVCRVNGATLLVHDVPEGTAACYRVEKASRNPRVFVTADAVLYDGTITEPTFRDETKQVILTHSWAGTTARLWINEFLEDPVLVLSKCDSIDLTDAIEGLDSVV